jgi:hypothetical protein
MYDSVVSITHTYPGYLFSVSAPANARPDAAAAHAGHDTLVALYPSQKPALDTLLAAELSGIPNGAPKAEGIQDASPRESRYMHEPAMAPLPP